MARPMDAPILQRVKPLENTPMAKKLQEEFTLTKHAQQRIRERFPHAMEEVDFLPTPADRLRKMYEFLWNATLENRVINDTLFMQYIQDKYGYDKSFRFFANQDMLFIGVVATNGNFIVTVVNRNDYVSRYLRPTEKKMQKKPVTFRRPPKPRPQLPAFRMKKREHLEADLYDY